MTVEPRSPAPLLISFLMGEAAHARAVRGLIFGIRAAGLNLFCSAHPGREQATASRVGFEVELDI